MFNLPPELALAVLVHLPIDSLLCLRLVCRHWQQFMNLRESVIYHQAAILHNLIPRSATSIEEAFNVYSKHSLTGVSGWKDLCQRRRYIEQSWSGKMASSLIPYYSAGTSVHRIKVDEKAGYILTTSCDGGLTVTDIETDQVLWSLSKNQVRKHAHCEYGEGYVIFDFADGAKEVWRRVDDYDSLEADQRVIESLPSPRQTKAFDSLAASLAGVSTRGHFQPWGLLRPPQPTRAFRFSYPTLGAAGWDHVFLWDVRTGALVQTIENTQRGANGDLEFLGDINYIEVGPRHVFLCGVHGLRGFSRETGRCVLDISSSGAPFGAWNFSIVPQPPTSTIPGSALVLQETVYRRIHRPQREIIDEFIAVHVSACGSHLAILLHSSKLVIVYNFERAWKESIPIHNISVEVQLGSPRYSSRYLAFENGRIGVATRTGIFVVEPDFSEDIMTLGPDTPPSLSILRAPSLGSRASLGAISCLQMTDTGLFLNWDPEPNPLDPDNPDELFYSSVEEDARYAVLVHGAFFLLVDDLTEADPDPEASVVFSIDFTPTVASTTVTQIETVDDSVE